MSKREGIVSMREVREEGWQEGKFEGRQQDLGRAAGSVAVGLRREVMRPASSPLPATPT